MSEEQMINMITNCAKMESALNLLRNFMLDEPYPVVLVEDKLNLVLSVAGLAPVKKEKAPNAGEQ